MKPANEFVYTVSSRLQATSSLTAALTCTELRRTKVCLPSDETTEFSLTEQTIVHHKSFIPMDTYKNMEKFSLTMLRFGINNDVCCSIWAKIDAAISLLFSSRKIGVIEVKIWKIINRSHVMDRATERFLIERYCYDKPVINSLQVLGGDSNLNGSRVEEEDKVCAICMENYGGEGTVVAGMPCNHDFHGDYISEWLQINRHCPLCRQISKDVCIFGTKQVNTWAQRFLDAST